MSEMQQTKVKPWLYFKVELRGIQQCRERSGARCRLKKSWDKRGGKRCRWWWCTRTVRREIRCDRGPISLDNSEATRLEDRVQSLVFKIKKKCFTQALLQENTGGRMSASDAIATTPLWRVIFFPECPSCGHSGKIPFKVSVFHINC